MIRTAILAVAALLALSLNAEARQRHKTYLAHPDCNILWPCEGVAPSPRGEMVVKAMRGFGSAQKVYTPAKEITHKASNSRHKSPALVAKEISPSYAPSPSLGAAISRPARFIAGRLVCAINVGVALAERGIKGTGSALALSYLHWGRSAGGPVPGAVIVSARRGGGHVAIVSRVENGVVFAWNATGGQSGWREIPYRHRVLDYRVPG